MCVNIRSKNKKPTIYQLINNWQQIALNNEGVTAHHHAMYFAIVRLANTLNWPQILRLPSFHVMSLSSIGSHTTYKKKLDDLVRFGAIQIVKKASNQHTCTEVLLTPTSSHEQADIEGLKNALRSACETTQDKKMEQMNVELRKAEKEIIRLRQELALKEQKLSAYEAEEVKNRLEKGDDLIIAQDDPKEENQDIEECPTEYTQMFKWFWKKYNFKVKEHRTKMALAKLPHSDYPTIFEHLPKYLESVKGRPKQFWTRPLTYIKDRCFEDEIIQYTDKKKSTMPPKEAKINYYKAKPQKTSTKQEPDFDFDHFINQLRTPKWKRAAS